MSEFRSTRGFEEALRPPVDLRRARYTPAVLGRSGSSRDSSPAARFARVATGAPEVMVKITGRTRDAGHLRAHLDYISRNGALALEGPDGERLADRVSVQALAEEWMSEMAMEPSRRKDAPVSLSVVLSMPKGVDPLRLQDAARAFASDIFGDRFPYVFVLHDEGKHPHVHLTVRMLGREGERLNPRKADLQVWREEFAKRLRQRDIEAEATPRRSRGVTRKAERTPVRKMRERFVAGEGKLPKVLEGGYRDAFRTSRNEPWKEGLASRDRLIRRALSAEMVAAERRGDHSTASLALDALSRRPEIKTRDDEIRRLPGKKRDRDREPL